MNYQTKKIYTAFMEGVCQNFNCMRALPALKKGFAALCEAVDGDSKHYVYAQGWFESSTPLEQLTEDEVSSKIKWTRVSDSNMSIMDSAKLNADRVLVDEPDNCLIVRQKGQASRPGMYKYFAQGQKVESNDAGKIFVYAQNWFESPTPLDELTENEVSDNLSYWTTTHLDEEAARARVEEAKSEAHRVVVDTPDKCFVVEEKGFPSKSGMHKYFARGMKFENENDFNDYKRVQDSIMEIEREDIGGFGGPHSPSRNYHSPSSHYFSHSDDDLEGRRDFGEYLGFGPDRDPRLNPKPPKGWDDDDDIEGRRDFGDYLGFGPGRDPSKNPRPPKGWRG